MPKPDKTTQDQPGVWEKGGPSPNPKGRPKGTLDVWARIRAKLKEKVKEGPHAGREYLDLAADAFVKGLLSGNWNQMKELLDREEGKVPDGLKILPPEPDGLADALDGHPELAELSNTLARRLAVARKPGRNGESAN